MKFLLLVVLWAGPQSSQSGQSLTVIKQEGLTKEMCERIRQQVVADATDAKDIRGNHLIKVVSHGCYATSGSGW